MTSVERKDPELEALELSDADVALTGGVDQVVAATVEPRTLVPTDREVDLGRSRPDYDFVAPAVPAAPRRGIGALFKEYLKRSDPRGIEGPKVPIVVFGLLALVGRWDDVAFGIILPEMRSEFTFDVAFIVVLYSGGLILGDGIGPFLGYLADRVKRVYMVRVGALIGNIASICMGLANGLPAMAGSRLLSTFGNTVPEPAQGPLLADYYPSTSRLRAYAVIGAAGIIGSTVGPLVAGELADVAGWRGAMIGLGVVATVASIGTFFLREPVRGGVDRLEMGASEAEAAQEQPPLKFGEAWRAARSITTLRRLWYASLFTPAPALAGIFIGFYLASQGLGPGERGRVLAIAAGLSVLALPLSGAVGDRLIRVKPGQVMVLLGAVTYLQAASFVVIAFSPNLVLSVIALMPATFLSALIRPAVGGLFALVVPARMRGLGMQTGKPFELASRLLLPGFLFMGVLFEGFTETPEQATLLGLAIPTAILGAIFSSASVGVARDIRAAKAVSMADQEAAAARERGRSKMLICRDVDVTYDGVQVVFGVDFDVEEGELVALLGTNGAGKSTLMRAICGLQEASAGAIFLDGRDITHQPPFRNARDGIVFVPGGHAIFPTLTVDENLRMAGWLGENDEEYLRERTAEVLELFPVLRTRHEQLAGNLSGGEQQMVALAQALLIRPRLLMIDELSLGLAPQIVEQLLATIRRINAQGTTVIIIEQSLNVAMTIARRAVFMEKGEIRFDGATSDLLQMPDLVRAVFMGGAVTGGDTATFGAGRRRSLEDRERLLAVDGISVRFGGVRALADATLEVHADEIVGIIGPNGAGKTTLFDVISGFVAPETGSVWLEGDDLTPLSPDARPKLGLGRSFQNARLFPSLTVRENIAVALSRRTGTSSPLLTAIWAPKVRKSERLVSRRTDVLIEILGLGAYADKFVNELSTGTRRSVDIACIMASQPRMLLLDEPSSGLAQAETEELGPVIERVARDAGCGILVIEHDIGLVSSISNRLYAMELGTVIASGSPVEVVNDPRVVSSYLAATDAMARSDLAQAVLGQAQARPAAGVELDA